MSLDALEPLLRVDRERVELGLERVDPRLECVELGLERVDLRARREQAIADGCTATILLTTIALGEHPSDEQLDAEHPEAAARYAAMTPHEAIREILHPSA